MASPALPEHLDRLDEALARHTLTLDSAIDTVLDQSVSKYPILVWLAEDADLEVGVLLAEHLKPGPWTLRVSTLEEFAAKQLLSPERIDQFRTVYTDARQQYCCFVVRAGKAEFAFRKRA